VAVKMIRNNDTMRKAAEKEKSILLSIAEHDPDNKKFCVRLLTHLEYRNHVALVFEFQSMNLRETLKKFGKDVGINIGAVRMYGRQLFVALKHLMDLRIVHADIKLDNILCSADLKQVRVLSMYLGFTTHLTLFFLLLLSNQVKLCDFGSAFRETDTDNDPTPYLVSRFYRAPEIILGMQCKSNSQCAASHRVDPARFDALMLLLPADDRAIDLWSVCTSLYELFTGHVMFPGRTNNEMLRLMMAVKGRFPNKLVSLLFCLQCSTGQDWTIVARADHY
jgi:serine/threonine-protein kinase PRP4